MRRNWIKLYVDQCLRGTMMDEMTDPAERFVWFGFLLLAGDSPHEGQISITTDMGYNNHQLGALLKCDSSIISSAKEKMIKHGKIQVLENDVIIICKWEKYQSEYGRLKKYRQPPSDESTEKSTDESTEKSTDESHATEREEELDKIRLDKISLKEKVEFFEKEFESLWKNYPPDGKKNKKRAKIRFIALCKDGKLEDFKKGYFGYATFLEYKKKRENFDQSVKYFPTLITDYPEYIQYYGEKVEPDL